MANILRTKYPIERWRIDLTEFININITTYLIIIFKQ